MDWWIGELLSELTEADLVGDWWISSCRLQEEAGVAGSHRAVLDKLCNRSSESLAKYMGPTNGMILKT